MQLRASSMKGFVVSYLGDKDPVIPDLVELIEKERELVDTRRKENLFVDTGDIELNENDFEIVRKYERKDYTVYFLKCLFDSCLIIAVERAMKGGVPNVRRGLLKERGGKGVYV